MSTVEARLRDLFDPLIEEGQCCGLYVWVAPGEGEEDAEEQLYQLLSRHRLRRRPDMGIVSTGLALRNVATDEAMRVMLRVCTEDLAYGVPGPWTKGEARPVLDELTGLLGPDARWLTNVEWYGDSPATHALTHHTFDNVVVGTGRGVVVGGLRVGED